MTSSIESLTAKYKSLTQKHQVFVALILLILGIIALPNTLVYGTAIFASYKFIDKKFVRYVVVSLFAVVTFFSGILWIAGDAPSIQEVTALDVSKTEESSLIENRVLDTADEVDTQLSTTTENSNNLYEVVRVVDGDTIDVSIDSEVERIRLIGINTPETVDPRMPLECFGAEASNKAKELLTGKKVSLESDPSQGERDKYDRLLRYVFIEGGINFNLLMIQTGFAYEYTYDLPYTYHAEFKEAQQQARERKIGLWGDMCQNTSTQSPSATAVPISAPVSGGNSCTIKGNISSSDEKIFHVVGCGSYSKTVIDESKGEKWFCSEQEALNAGWRKALNCN